MGEKNLSEKTQNLKYNSLSFSLSPYPRQHPDAIHEPAGQLLDVLLARGMFFFIHGDIVGVFHMPEMGELKHNAKTSATSPLWRCLSNVYNACSN
jgi:hypothetical protein